MDHRPEEADVASAWNRNADRWTDDVRAGFDLYRELYTLPAFMAFMPPIDGRRVIDLGCGEGSDTRRFARLGGQLTGIDLSEALIRRAREEESREPLGIRYEVRSYSRMEAFAAGSFDCALSTMALMDGPNIVSAMHEAHRVLTPGGTLCFSILHPCFVTRGLEWLRSADGAYSDSGWATTSTRRLSSSTGGSASAQSQTPCNRSRFRGSLARCLTTSTRSVMPGSGSPRSMSRDRIRWLLKSTPGYLGGTNMHL